MNLDWIISVPNINDPICSLWKEANSCIKCLIGGAGTTFAKAAKSAGFATSLLSKVGYDFIGDYLLNDLRIAGITPLICQDKETSSGKVIIIEDKFDQKTMVSHRGANSKLNTDDVSVNMLAGVDLLYISGYTILEKPQSDAVIAMINAAKELGKFVFIDVVPHRVFCTPQHSELKKMLHRADGLSIEIGTARRMLQLDNAEVDVVLSSLSDTYRFIIAIPDNNTFLVNTNGTWSELSTGYDKAENRVGYLDKCAAKVLFNFAARNLCNQD